MATNVNPEHEEGRVGSAIEGQTAKLPSDFFLWAALGSMAIPRDYRLQRKQACLSANGLHPSYCLGFYNKLVKLEGHD